MEHWIAIGIICYAFLHYAVHMQIKHGKLQDALEDERRARCEDKKEIFGTLHHIKNTLIESGLAEGNTQACFSVSAEFSLYVKNRVDDVRDSIVALEKHFGIDIVPDEKSTRYKVRQLTKEK